MPHDLELLGPSLAEYKMLDDRMESPKKAINRLCVSSPGITSQQQKLLYTLCWQQHMAIHSVVGIKQQTFPSAEPAAGEGCRAAPYLLSCTTGYPHSVLCSYPLRVLTRNMFLLNVNYGT